MNAATPIALNLWIQRVGITPVTAWRWRKQGWINPINICGRLYMTPADIENFNRRAQSGEFAKEHKTPKRESSIK